MSSNQCQYKISVVMPIYNTEMYLNEAIDSVIHQTIGFEDNVQLILINDGSSDRSEEICLSYKEKYPNNIIYQYKENGGVSDACNAGIPFVNGKYVNFMSSDDYWEEDAFKKAYAFFEEHEKEIDIVSCKIDYFERFHDRAHPLDKKYVEDTIVDLSVDYDKINVTIGNTFIKAEKLSEVRFNTSLIMYEDDTLIVEILLDKQKYGIISSVRYLYRKRENMTSLTASASLDKRWYMDVVKHFYLYLINLSINRYGKVLDFVQYLIIYQIQYQTRNANIKMALSEPEQEEFRHDIEKVLEYIEPRMIYIQGNSSIVQKFSILNKKFETNILESAEYKDNGLYYKNNKIFAFDSKRRINIFKFKIKKEILIIEGVTDTILFGDRCKMFIRDSKGGEYEPTISTYAPASRYLLFEGDVESRKKFKFEISLKDEMSMQFIISYEDNELISSPTWEESSRMIGGLPTRYIMSENYVVRLDENNITISEASTKNRIALSFQILTRMIKYKKISLLLRRIKHVLGKFFGKKRINVILTPKYEAEENNIIYEYIIQKSNNECIFVNPADKNRLKTLLINAEYVYITDLGINLYDIYSEDYKYIQDLCTYNTIYLNEYNVSGKLPKWKDKFTNSIDIITVASKKEKNVILESNCGYEKDDVIVCDNVVVVSGHNSIDSKQNENAQNTLLVLFSWNRVLSGELLSVERVYDPSHKDSFIYDIYDELIKNEELDDAIKRNNYECKIFLHPTYAKADNQYVDTQFFTFSADYSNIQEIINNSSILLTDQSHFALDFINDDKPVVYCDFDDIIINNESERPVDLNNTITSLINAMNNQ